jgi:2'-5' RNA ligase
MSDMRRVFVALEPDAAVRAAVERVQARLRYVPGASAVRWTRLEHLHLTLLFLGNVARERVAELAEALGTACNDKSEFALQTGQLGCFPSFKKPSVVWLGFEADDAQALFHLHDSIALAGKPYCEMRDRREFVAHLTVGRIKPGHRSAKLFGTSLQAHSLPRESVLVWPIKSVFLVESELRAEGPRYTVLNTWRLAPLANR